MKTISKAVITLAALCAASSLVPAFAESANNNVALAKQQRAATTLNHYSVLREPPQHLPYMVAVTPPGGKFLYGMKKPAGKGKITLILRYGIADTPANTLKYYADTLKQARWNVNASPTTVAAAYKGNTCNVTAFPASSSQYRNDIQMIYKLSGE
jgi:hypothetical protein